MPAIGPDLSRRLTAPEVAAIVAHLEGEPCTPRRVRYLLSADLSSDTRPISRRTRPYDAVDVARMRLAVRLEAQGVSAWVVRVVLAYCGDEILAAWRSRAVVALAVRGVTGTIEPATSGVSSSAITRVLLRSVLVGNASAMRRAERSRSHVGQPRLSAGSLAPVIA